MTQRIRPQPSTFRRPPTRMFGPGYPINAWLTDRSVQYWWSLGIHNLSTEFPAVWSAIRCSKGYKYWLDSCKCMIWDELLDAPEPSERFSLSVAFSAVYASALKYDIDHRDERRAIKREHRIMLYNHCLVHEQVKRECYAENPLWDRKYRDKVMRERRRKRING